MDEIIAIKGRQSEHAALVSGNHIFDVDVGIFSSVLLQNLEGFLNQISQIFVFSLRIINFISDVYYIKYAIHLLFLNILKTGRICL